MDFERPNFQLIGEKSFTPGVREIARLAIERAKKLNRSEISPVDYLYGLARRGDGFAVEVLRNLGIKATDIYDKINEGFLGSAIVPGQGCREDPKTEIKNNLLAQEMLKEAVNVSDELKCGWIGSEFLLMALLRVQESESYEILRSFDLNEEEVRKEFIGLIHSKSSQSGDSSGGNEGNPIFPGDLL